MTKAPVQFQKYQHTIVGGVADTRYSLSIHFDRIWAWKMIKFKMKKKKKKKIVTKINLRIISKSHAHLLSMIKTPVQFQKDRDTIVGVPTTYTLWQYLSLKNDLVQNADKVIIINLRIIYKSHVHILRPWQKHLYSFKKLCNKNCRRSCGHKVPTTYTLWYYLSLKNVQVQNPEKVIKSNQRIISKSHALLQTMTKTSKSHASLQTMIKISNRMHIFRPWQKHLYGFKKISLKL